MRDNPHRLQAGTASLADHVFHEPTTHAAPLGAVLDEKQIQLRRIEHEAVDTEQIASVPVDRDEDAVRLDVVGSDSVVDQGRSVPAPVGIRRSDQCREAFGILCDGAFHQNGLHQPSVEPPRTPCASSGSGMSKVERLSSRVVKVVDVENEPSEH